MINENKKEELKQMAIEEFYFQQLAKSKIKEFNNNEISIDELLEWMKENKDILKNS